MGDEARALFWAAKPDQEFLVETSAHLAGYTS
jgi:hypothetical protein